MPQYLGHTSVVPQPHTEPDKQLSHIRLFTQTFGSGLLSPWLLPKQWATLWRIIATPRDNAEKAGKSVVARENMFIHYDILAAAYAELGKFEAAVEWQTKAIEAIHSEIPASVQLHSPAKLRSRLEIYKAGKPYREEPKK